MGQICVFGDSITWGAWDLEQGGWVNRLRLQADEISLATGSEHLVFNCGVSGDRVEHLLARFPAEAAARQPERVVIAIGTNDTPHEDYPGTGIGAFIAQYEALLVLARGFDSSPLLVGPCNVDEAVLPGWSNKAIDTYVGAVRDLAANDGLDFVDTFGSLEAHDLVPDGLHPSASGHAKLAALIGPSISPNFPNLLPR